MDFLSVLNVKTSLDPGERSPARHCSGEARTEDTMRENCKENMQARIE